MYYLGIDGGGSKTDFVLADESLKIIKRVRISKGSNPWHEGIDQTLSIIDEGLIQFEEYKSDVSAVVAGISGCFAKNRFSLPILTRLRELCPQAKLVGDLPISFRAVTNAKSGIIAIAGTGSSVVHFFSDGSSYVYDAVGTGGRDVGFMLAQAFLRKQIGQAGSKFLQQAAPVLEFGELRATADFYHDPSLRNLPRSVSRLDVNSPEFKDFQPWLDSIADRWRFKLYGIITKFLSKETDADHATVVLNGGLWHFDYLREQVTRPLKAEFRNVKIIFDSQAEPVLGALKMAKELAGK